MEFAGELEDSWELYMNLYGFEWICMDLYGFIWIYTDLNGFIWIYIDVWVILGYDLPDGT